VAKRFARAEHLIDRAEQVTRSRGARHKLHRVAKLLGKGGAGVVRLGERDGIASSCAVNLSAMLAEGERRANDLAATF